MQHDRSHSASSLAWNTQGIHAGSISSGSPIGSPLASPLHSPCDSPREQLHNQFARQVSLQPPGQQQQPSVTTTTTGTTNTTTTPSNTKQANNTFVHKLFNMVVDKQYQHLIAWTYPGTSFIVCNITEFSRDVLPKHFKHSNFSSFVRQLNMYGFHKVNKSPRGHRALAENQIWEFSHPKFLRGRGDLLEEIKRKALDTDVVRRDQSDIGTHMAVMQVAQSDMMQQLAQLQQNFNELVRELQDTRKRQQAQQQTMKQLMNYMIHQQGVSWPDQNIKPEPIDTHPPPPIFVTTADPHHQQHEQQQQQQHLQQQQQQQNAYNTSNISLPSRPSMPLTVQTQNLHHLSTMQHMSSTHSATGESPASLSPMTALNTPIPPSPSTMLSDDDVFYTPQPSPGGLNMQHSMSSDHLSVDGFNFHQQQSPQSPISYNMHTDAGPV
ncbi:hypothetical protein LRAMOSA10880 [Lichtheimia ramosa]|uniref:HSF-type DNA-binding domain-containing protein n=1 Tax=Lichtheimia ramosa TaxID=688394 RepID=A0A077WQ82_9FUNG|nr:hypothetical protein LRAMOSA10880 [Lichtheimia ramosa]